jgi:hypothetical protein
MPRSMNTRPAMIAPILERDSSRRHIVAERPESKARKPSMRNIRPETTLSIFRSWQRALQIPPDFVVKS